MNPMLWIPLAVWTVFAIVFHKVILREMRTFGCLIVGVFKGRDSHEYMTGVISRDALPDWLINMVDAIDEPEKDELGKSRDEMYKSLELFRAHVKGVIGTCFAILAVLAAVSRFEVLPGQGGAGHPLLNAESIEIAVILAATVFIPLFCMISITVIRQYYRVYLAALLYAVVIHVRLNHHHAHPWIRDILRMAVDWKHVKDYHTFVEERIELPLYTYKTYFYVLAIFGAASVFLGGLILYST